MKVVSACKKGEKGIYWSYTADRHHSPSHSCGQKCASQATNSAIQPLPMFWSRQGVPPSHDHAASEPHPVIRPNHQGHNSYPYRIRCSSHWLAPASNHQASQREGQLGKMFSKNHQPVPNLEHIPKGWRLGGLKIDYPVITSCSHCRDLHWGSGPVVRIGHQIGPFLILLGGLVWHLIPRGKVTIKLVSCSTFEHSGSK